MTGDGHKMTLGSHDVTQQAQVSVVDVQTVEVQHKGNLLLYALSDSFDTEGCENFADIVGAGTHGVNISLSQNLKKINIFNII